MGQTVSCGGCLLISWPAIFAADIGSSAMVVETVQLTAVLGAGDWGLGVLLGGLLWPAGA